MKNKVSDKLKLVDPLRGLRGELKRKMIANLAGHRSGNLTHEEFDEIDKIQLEHDRLYNK